MLEYCAERKFSKLLIGPGPMLWSTDWKRELRVTS